MTQVRGGMAGPDGAGGAYDNEVQTDRAVTFMSLGGRGGLVYGGGLSVVSGLLAVDVAAFMALCPETFPSGADALRGYVVWADVNTRVGFATPSSSSRVDGIIAFFVDTEAGPVGSAALPVGAHVVAVPGTPGSSSAPSKSDILAYCGRGGYLRLGSATVPAGATAIAAGDLYKQKVQLNTWRSFAGDITPSSGWGISLARYIINGCQYTIEMALTRPGSTVTPGANGNFGDVPICTGVPAALCPASGDPNIFGDLRNGARFAGVRLDDTGAMFLTDMYPGSTISSADTTMNIRLTYALAQG